MPTNYSIRFDPSKPISEELMSVLTSIILPEEVAVHCNMLTGTRNYQYTGRLPNGTSDRIFATVTFIKPIFIINPHNRFPENLSYTNFVVNTYINNANFITKNKILSLNTSNYYFISTLDAVRYKRSNANHPNKKKEKPFRFVFFNEDQKIGQGGNGSFYKGHRYIPENVGTNKPFLKTMGIKAVTTYLDFTKITSKESYSHITKEYEMANAAGFVIKNPTMINKSRTNDLCQMKSYMPMEFVEGRTLSNLLRNHTRASLPLTRRFLMGLKILLAAEQLHDNGVLNLDLKPGNIMIDESTAQTEAVIIDFGLAMRCGTQNYPILYNGEKSLRIISTPAYLAPEGFDLPELANIDVVATYATDMYSLGLILHGLFYGSKPHAGYLTYIATHHLSDSFSAVYDYFKNVFNVEELIKQTIIDDPIHPTMRAELTALFLDLCAKPKGTTTAEIESSRPRAKIAYERLMTIVLPLSLSGLINKAIVEHKNDEKKVLALFNEYKSDITEDQCKTFVEISNIAILTGCATKDEVMHRYESIIAVKDALIEDIESILASMNDMAELLRAFKDPAFVAFLKQHSVNINKNAIDALFTIDFSNDVKELQTSDINTLTDIKNRAESALKKATINQMIFIKSMMAIKSQLDKPTPKPGLFNLYNRHDNKSRTRSLHYIDMLLNSNESRLITLLAILEDKHGTTLSNDVHLSLRLGSTPIETALCIREIIKSEGDNSDLSARIDHMRYHATHRVSKSPGGLSSRN